MATIERNSSSFSTKKNNLQKPRLQRPPAPGFDKIIVDLGTPVPNVVVESRSETIADNLTSYLSAIDRTIDQTELDGTVKKPANKVWQSIEKSDKQSFVAPKSKVPSNSKKRKTAKNTLAIQPQPQPLPQNIAKIPRIPKVMKNQIPEVKVKHFSGSCNSYTENNSRQSTMIPSAT